MIENRNQLEEWDREHFFHPSTHMAQHARGESPTRVIEGGEGVHIVDREGKRSLDAFAGLYCVNVGYGRREIADAIAEQAHKLAYYHAYAGHGSEAAIRLSRMIIERAPEGMSRVYYGLSGSDANETNIKLVWYCNNVLGRPEKKKIISRWRGYHGSGVMTGSLTGLELFHKAFDLPRAPILHTDAPYYFRRDDLSQSEAAFSAQCAANLEALILAEGPDTVAAFIGEPVLGTIEMRAIPHWMPWCRLYGRLTLLIMSIHHLDSFRYLFGEPESVYVSARPDPRTKFEHRDGIALYILEYANGFRAAAWDDVWAGPAREGGASDLYIKWRVEGDRGMAQGAIGWPAYPNAEPSTIEFTTALQPGVWFKPEWKQVWFPDAFQGPMGMLLGALNRGAEPVVSGRDNLKTMALIEACYRSLDQHRPVRPQEILEEKQDR